MKKVFAFVLAVLCVATLSMAVVSAAPSPSKDAPVVDSVSSSNADWKGEVKTYTSNTADIPAEVKATLATATAAAQKLDVAQLINKNNVAVQDVFDVSATAGEFGTLTISLNIGKDVNFAGLLQFTNNDWEEVKGATYDKATGVMTFTVDSLSPFAIVVNTTQTGDSFNYWLYAVIALVAGTAAVVLFVVGKKKTIDG